MTGASGFIGSFIVEEALRRGYEVWAGVRPSSSREYLRDPAIHFIELDFGCLDHLWPQLRDHNCEHGKFDYVVHCAGVTKCADKRDFEQVNYRQTKLFADVFCDLEMVPRQFIFISTLSVFGPVHEKDYLPITERDAPRPNTAYGLSKFQAECALQGLPDFP